MVKEASVGISVTSVNPSYVRTSNKSRDHMDDELASKLSPLPKSTSSSQHGNPAHAFVLQFKRLQSCHH